MTVQTMMACGHAANGTRADGSPVCVICVGINEGATTVVAPPDLTGRISRCNDCGKELPSDGPHKLAFFSHRPDRDRDSHYDGCFGWD